MLIQFNFRKNQNMPITPVPNSRLQKQISSEPHVWLPEDISPSSEQPRVTLDSIITEYLTNQHALCKNPMATCPQFNLFMWVFLIFTSDYIFYFLLLKF